MVAKYLKALLFEWRLQRAKKKARHDAALYGRKFLVIVFRRRPVVVSMRALKTLIRRHRFAKGFTAQKAEACALFIARPGNPKTTAPCS